MCIFLRILIQTYIHLLSNQIFILFFNQLQKLHQDIEIEIIIIIIIIIWSYVVLIWRVKLVSMPKSHSTCLVTKAVFDFAVLLCFLNFL